MHACSAQRSHSHKNFMDIFRTLESESLSLTAILDFSGTLLVEQGSQGVHHEHKRMCIVLKILSTMSDQRDH